jgi:asparagine synthetase B (glutamine-hydrolysing)
VLWIAPALNAYKLQFLNSLFNRGRLDIIVVKGELEGEASRQEGTTSDWHYARRLADDWGLSLRSVDIGSGNLTREQIRTTVHFADDRIADAAQIPSYLIARGAAGTSKVFCERDGCG